MPIPLVAGFLSNLLRSAHATFRAFVIPDLGLKVPAGVLTALLIAGVFLLGLGMVVTSFGKKEAARLWVPVGIAVGTALAGWVLAGGRKDVSQFFVVISLVLKFLAGVTFLAGFFRTPWIPLGLAVGIVVSAAGWVEEGLLGTVISFAASLLGAWSFFRNFERLSPGKRKSRWNQRTAAGWFLCLLAATMLEGDRLAALGGTFKLSGIVVGGALVLLMPRAFPDLLRPKPKPKPRE